MLEDSYASIRELADTVNWKEYNCNDLFRQYIEHENDELKDAFYAGILCRYWGYIGRVYNQCNKHVPIEQCYDVIIDSINYVLKKRAWEDPNNSIYNDPLGPDKAMHIVMKRQKGIMLAKLTAQKRQTDIVNISLDEAKENFNDASEGLLLGNKIKDQDSETAPYSDLITMIGDYFRNGDYLSGLILDIICFSGIVNYSDSKVVKGLNNLSKSDYAYYKKVYNAEEKEYNKLLYNIANSSSFYLKMKVNALLHMLEETF